MEIVARLFTTSALFGAFVSGAMAESCPGFSGNYTGGQIIMTSETTFVFNWDNKQRVQAHGTVDSHCNGVFTFPDHRSFDFSFDQTSRRIHFPGVGHWDKNPTHLLQIKYTSRIQEIWTDAGSGANSSVKIYRPALEPGYHSLGDVAWGSHGGQPLSIILVKSSDPSVFSKPLHYERVWKDSGSGAHRDVSFWRPVAQSGYTCLGDVAMGNHNTAPSNDLIRCLRNDYVAEVGLRTIWTDAGSGADRDSAIFQSDNSGKSEVLPVTSMVTNGRHDTHGIKGQGIRASLIDGVGFNERDSSYNDETLDLEFWKKVAQVYQPIVYLHSDETFYPGDAQQFFNQARKQGQYLTYPLSCNQPNCATAPILRGNKNAPVYAAILRKDSPTNSAEYKSTDHIVDVIYWMFYPYNEGKYLKLSPAYDNATYGSHVGDWEHYTVRFVNGYPYKVYLSAHSGGTRYAFSGTEFFKQMDNNGFTSRIFSAKGSHALYSMYGSYTYESFGIPLILDVKLTDHMNDGYAWKGPLQAFVAGTENPSWMSYMGRWGNAEDSCFSPPFTSDSFCKLESGPTGINLKNSMNPGFIGLD